MAGDGNVATAKTEAEQQEDLKVVDVKLEGGKLIVTVESDQISKLVEGAARKLAYEERLKHGMAQAGIESLGGTYITDEEREQAKAQGRDVSTWRADFRITPMI
jgi:hypothetical protein